MPFILKYVSAKVLGWAMAVIGAVIAFLSAYRSGRKAARAEVDRASAEAGARMTDAAVKAPTEKEDVAKDLRAGRF
jgi:hypothetical protein